MIRKANIDDIEQIYNLINIHKFKNYTRTFLNNIIHDNSYLVLVLEEDNQILGYGIFTIIFESSDVIIIGIESRVQNKGYGSMLLKEAISIMKERGVENLNLEVNVNNYSAINLYKKFNFKTLTTRKNYYGNNNDAFFMQLLIKEN